MFVPSGFFAFRTPLLSFDELLAWGSDLAASTADPDTLEAALTSDRAVLRARLARTIARPEVREALFLASPSLDENLHVWLEAPASERAQKAERTLTRYFPRMAGRCTPFGLFAGCSMGSIGERTHLAIEGRDAYRRNTRLDMDYVFSLCDALARDPATRETLVYRPSSSLYRAAGQFRYAEAHAAGRRRSYHLVAMEPTEYLVAALTRAAGGARLAEIVDAVIDPANGIEREDATAFVAELVDAQVILPDLHPAVTGVEPLDGLLATLDDGPVAQGLRATRAWLEAHDRSRLGVEPAQYRRVAEELRALPADVDLGLLFQVDMVKSAPELSLGRTIVDEIASIVETLHSIAPARRDDPLEKFQRDFVERYEEREVPLVEVLDEEAGIGFDASSASAAEPSPLLDQLVFPSRAEAETAAWGPRAAVRLKKLEQAIRDRATEIVLEPSDLEALANKQVPSLPKSFAVMMTIAARDQTALDAGDYRLGWVGISGPSGANLLGRFCHGDAALTENVIAHLRAEEALAPNAIHAEIVHLPHGRIGNILARPALREYEIPYLGKAGVPPEKQITVDDLVVSVRNGRVVLRSKRLDREVIPRMTTAHNFSSPQNLGVYRFLCAFQMREHVPLGWTWGPLRDASYLPRVVLGRCVLSPATWRFDRTTCAALGTAKSAALFRTVQELRRARGLPRFIELVEGDNTLPIDLDNILAIETFAQLLKGRSDATITEMFPGPDELVARGPEGRFAHQIVVPFVRTDVPARPRGEVLVSSGVRRFVPGSEWLYARLYAGTGSLDHALRTVAPIIRDATTSGAIDRWFFVRYEDPAFHIRVRFHGAPARLLGEVLPALEQATRALLAEGRMHRFDLGTYERELERYGGALGIESAEQLFHADSDAVLAILEMVESGAAGSDARWRLAVRGSDQLLDDLGFDLPGKLAAIRVCRDVFAREFEVGVDFERQLGDKFRIERKPLEALLDRGNDRESDFGPALEVFAERSRRAVPIARALADAKQRGAFGHPLEMLAGDLVHLHVNRLLRGAHRAQELVIYDLLTRLYEGRIARARRNKS